MKKHQARIANMALGFASVYALFNVGSISETFPPTVVQLIKQLLISGFAVCLFISPKSVIALGAAMSPKITSILNVFFGGKSKDDNNEIDK